MCRYMDHSHPSFKEKMVNVKSAINYFQKTAISIYDMAVLQADVTNIEDPLNNIGNVDNSEIVEGAEEFQSILVNPIILRIINKTNTDKQQN